MIDETDRAEGVDQAREPVLPEQRDNDQVGAVGVAGVKDRLGYAELKAMEISYTALEPLDSNARARAIRWLSEAFNISSPIVPTIATAEAKPEANSGQTFTSGSSDRASNPSAKEFISSKRPQSLVERVACLAYYLTHFRNVPHFKTPDIVQLNTEAASHRFGNPSRDVDNADRQNGYIVSAGNGAKQLTVRGEALVDALPDRDAVAAALKEHPHKSKRPSPAGKKSPRVKSEK
ncbi:hypothetical protein AB0869_21000 [Micromonospora vinacea]|uniref:hypothetical protein n=1 Tax=Micromonospora vinacea TaxID=709878 RepID=UPI003451C578